MILTAILWICVFIFAATGLIAILDLAGIRKISSSFMRKALFTSLILELAIVCVAALPGFLNSAVQNINNEQIQLYHIVIKLQNNQVIHNHQMALVKNPDGSLKTGFLVGLDTKNENTSLKNWRSNAVAIDKSSFIWSTEDLKSKYSSKATIKFTDSNWRKFEGNGVDGNLGEQNSRVFTITGDRFYP